MLGICFSSVTTWHFLILPTRSRRSHRRYSNRKINRLRTSCFSWRPNRRCGPNCETCRRARHSRAQTHRQGVREGCPLALVYEADTLRFRFGFRRPRLVYPPHRPQEARQHHLQRREAAENSERNRTPRRHTSDPLGRSQGLAERRKNRGRGRSAVDRRRPVEVDGQGRCGVLVRQRCHSLVSYAVSPSLLLASSPELQLRRLMARDKSTRADASSRLDSQFSITSKVAYADLVVDNSGSLTDLDGEVMSCLGKLERAVGWGWMVRWLLPPVGLLSAVWCLSWRVFKRGRRRRRG